MGWLVARPLGRSLCAVGVCVEKTTKARARGGALTPRIMTTALTIIAAWAPPRDPWPTRHRHVTVGASNPGGGGSGRARGHGNRQGSRRLSLSLSRAAVRGLGRAHLGRRRRHRRAGVGP